MLDNSFLWHGLDASRVANPSHPSPIRATKTDGIGVINVVGGLSRDGAFGTSTDQLRSELAAMANDPAVRAIVLRINSPGGTVAGTADAGDAVAAAAKIKPIYAFIEDIGASAAYWLASQAKQIIAGRSALVGSIGTFSLLVDDSKAWESVGIKIHLISTGPHKGTGTIGQPVSESSLAEVRRVVESMNAQFLAAVGTGRRMTPQAVAQVSTGQIWIASEAKQLGLIDGIGSFDQLLAGINRAHPVRQASTATQIFNSLVAHEVSRGLKKSQAIPRVVAANPALHRAYLAEANAGR